MAYRIALCGFSEFEYRAMHFSFQHPTADEAAYEVVDALADADFAVVDADSKPAVKGVVLSGRVAHSVFVGATAPTEATAHIPRPIDPTRILRALAELAARHPPVPPDRAPVPVALVEELIVAAHEAPLPVPPAAPPVAPHNGAAKAAARAAARRARLASLQSEPGHAEPSRDVMVFDADVTANTALCELLERFGFDVHTVYDFARARKALEICPFAAIFLDIALDDSDAGQGFALLQAIRELPVPEGHSAPAVLLVASKMHPSDRVRASLAGVSSPLIKPVSRGDAARALEGCGVTLPADARRN